MKAEVLEITERTPETPGGRSSHFWVGVLTAVAATLTLTHLFILFRSDRLAVEMISSCGTRGGCGAGSLITRATSTPDYNRCLETCQIFADDCNHFTFDAETSDCLLFSTCLLDETRGSCTSGHVWCPTKRQPVCGASFACKGRTVGDGTLTSSSYPDCMDACRAEIGCNWASFFPESGLCVMTEDCFTAAGHCPDCTAGERDCPLSVPPEDSVEWRSPTIVQNEQPEKYGNSAHYYTSDLFFETAGLVTLMRTGSVDVSRIYVDWPHIVYGDMVGTIHFFDLLSSTLVEKDLPHIDIITSIASSERYFSAGSLDNTVSVWEKTNFKLINILMDHTDTVFCVRISNDYLVTFGGDGVMFVYLTEDWSRIAKVQLEFLVSNDGASFLLDDVLQVLDGNVIKLFKLSSDGCEEIKRTVIAEMGVGIAPVFSSLLASELAQITEADSPHWLASEHWVGTNEGGSLLMVDLNDGSNLLKIKLEEEVIYIFQIQAFREYLICTLSNENQDVFSIIAFETHDLFAATEEETVIVPYRQVVESGVTSSDVAIVGKWLLYFDKFSVVAVSAAELGELGETGRGVVVREEDVSLPIDMIAIHIVNADLMMAVASDGAVIPVYRRSSNSPIVNIDVDSLTMASSDDFVVVGGASVDMGSYNIHVLSRETLTLEKTIIQYADDLIAAINRDFLVIVASDCIKVYSTRDWSLLDYVSKEEGNGPISLEGDILSVTNNNNNNNDLAVSQYKLSPEGSCSLFKEVTVSKEDTEWITSLSAAADGTYWIGTSSGYVIKVEDSEFTLILINSDLIVAQVKVFKSYLLCTLFDSKTNERSLVAFDLLSRDHSYARKVVDWGNIEGNFATRDDYVIYFNSNELVVVTAEDIEAMEKVSDWAIIE